MDFPADAQIASRHCTRSCFRSRPFPSFGLRIRRLHRQGMVGRRALCPHLASVNYRARADRDLPRAYGASHVRADFDRRGTHLHW